MAQRLGRPEPYIKNGTGAFYKQLKKLVVNYCDYGGSSKHIRNYILTDLIEYAKANPSVEVAVEQRRGHHPALRGYYLNGRDKVIGIKNLEFADIHKHVMLLTTTSGEKVTRLKGNVFGDPLHPKDLWTPFDMVVKKTKSDS